MPALHTLGEIFAGYEIVDSIARGGMGQIYRARNPRLGRQVALKLLAPELLKDPLFRERFMRESQIAASLDHPNVIPIYDAGEAEGVPYIAMRYIDGPDLRQLIDEGPVPLAHTISIVAQVGSALSAAHELGLVHRDVKPANVLVDKYVGADATPHVYLSDFGVAKKSISRSGLTSTGQFVGTIDYVAPEQIEGGQVDGRTDVYALGCVLYECLTGRKPFERDSNVAVIYAHLVDAPPKPSEGRSDIPPAFDGVVAKAMAKSPNDRYATADELAAAGRAALDGASLPATTVAASLPATTVAAKSAAETRPAPRPPATPTTMKTAPVRSRSRIPKAILAVVVLLAIASGAFAAVRSLTGSEKETTKQSRPQRPNLPVAEGPSAKPPPKRIPLPSLVGMTPEQAAVQIRRLRLRPIVVREYSAAKTGFVYAQVPPVGKRLVKGASVRLLVSLGPAPPAPVTPVPPAPVPPPGGGGGGGVGGGGGGGGGGG